MECSTLNWGVFVEPFTTRDAGPRCRACFAGASMSPVSKRHSVCSVFQLCMLSSRDFLPADVAKVINTCIGVSVWTQVNRA